VFSKVPIDIAKMSKEDINKEMLRAALIAELDAINLYEQMAGMTENDEVRRVLLDVAKEEKTHIGEFQTLLLRMDKEQVEELEAGREEVDEELHK
jgi:rubrerythrin